MKNGKIDKYLFEGGYAQATAANSTTDKFAFNYYNQDHLGNNREVVDASGAVTQVTNYYPFGAPYADASASKGSDVQPYKYNGKELDLMHGLNTYDYGARQHDPILARWDRIDPLCEKYYNVSPYNYCLNNPVRFIDPDGKEVGAPDNWGKTLGIREMELGGIVATAGVIVATIGGVAEVPTVGVSTPITVSGGTMIGLGGSMMVAGWTTYTMNSNDNSGESSISSSSSSSVSSSSASNESPDKKKKTNPKKEARQKAKEKRDKQPASEQYVKYKAKELQKKLGKDARRNAHDQKEKGEPDRNKNQINEDYHY